MEIDQEAESGGVGMHPREMTHQPFVAGVPLLWLFFFFLFWILGLIQDRGGDKVATWFYTSFWVLILLCTVVCWFDLVRYRTPIYRTRGAWRVSFGILLILYWVIPVTSVHALALMYFPGWAEPIDGLDDRWRKERSRQLTNTLRSSQDQLKTATMLGAYFAANPEEIFKDEPSSFFSKESMKRSLDGRVTVTYMPSPGKLGAETSKIEIDGSVPLRIRVVPSRGKSPREYAVAVKEEVLAAERKNKVIVEEVQAASAAPVDGRWLGARGDWLRLLSESPAWTYSVTFKGSLLYRMWNALAALITGTLAVWTAAPFWRVFKRWLESGPIR